MKKKLLIQPWHPADIKAAIYKKGTSLTRLALENGLDVSTLSLALKKPSKQAEIIISNCIEVPKHELWPDRWTETGQRVCPRFAYKYITCS